MTAADIAAVAVAYLYLAAGWAAAAWLWRGDHMTAIECPGRAEGCTDECCDERCTPEHVAAIRELLAETRTGGAS